MFSFGRKRFDDPGAEFWKWWPGARDGIAKAIVTGAFDDRIVNDISKHVQRVHPQMAWELQPGTQAAHAFCLSPEGNPELRQVALRWLERAPQPDATWEYHASKQPAKSLMTLMVAGGRFDLEEMRASTAWDERRRSTACGTRASPRSRTSDQAAFLFLDHLLARTASSAGSARSSCSRADRRANPPSSRPRSNGGRSSRRPRSVDAASRGGGRTTPRSMRRRPSRGSLCGLPRLKIEAART